MLHMQEKYIYAGSTFAIRIRTQHFIDTLIKLNESCELKKLHNKT